MKSRIPKVLHKLCGVEMISLVVASVREARFDTTVVVVSKDSLGIRHILGDTVSYAVQSEQLGTGHALLQASPLLRESDNVVVLCGDLPLVPSQSLLSIMERHQERSAVITLLTAVLDDPSGLGRIVRDGHGGIRAVAEDSDADEATRFISEVNGGIYCFRSSWLWSNLNALSPSPRGEIFLTDLVARAHSQGETVASILAEDPRDIGTVNTRVQLSEVEGVLRERIRERWMLSGVTMPDPGSVYIDFAAELGEDTVVHPNTHVTGSSRVGRECEIGPNSVIDSADIGDNCRVFASVVERSKLSEGVVVGPFSHIRHGSRLGRGVRIGNFAEVKNSYLGSGTRSGHFSYIGDAWVGNNVNYGAGAVTCNYDGKEKHSTHIEDDAFIGSDTMLIAPVSIGKRSATGAGSVVNKDVPSDSQAVGVPAKIRPKERRKSRS